MLEFIITDDDKIPEKCVPSPRSKLGLILRDFDKDPVAAPAATPTVTLIPENEWEARLREQEKAHPPR